MTFKLLYFANQLIKIYDLDELRTRNYSRHPLESMNFIEITSHTGYHPNERNVSTFSLRLIEQMVANVNINPESLREFKQVISLQPNQLLYFIYQYHYEHIKPSVEPNVTLYDAMREDNIPMLSQFETRTASQWKTGNFLKKITEPQKTNQKRLKQSTNQDIMRKVIKVHSLFKLHKQTKLI